MKKLVCESLDDFLYEGINIKKLFKDVKAKIDIKDLKKLAKSAGLKKGMNFQQIFSQLKKSDNEELINKISQPVVGKANTEAITESYLKVGEFFNKNKWARYVFVALIMLTIFSAKSLANVNQEFSDNGISIELDGSGDDGDGEDLEPKLEKFGVQEVEKMEDGSYKVTVIKKVDQPSRNTSGAVGRMQSQSILAATQEAGLQSGEDAGKYFGTIDHEESKKGTKDGKLVTITVVKVMVKGTGATDYQGQETSPQKSSGERQKTTKSDYLESTFGDEDI